MPYGWLQKVELALSPQPTLPACSLPAASLSRMQWRAFEGPQQQQQQQRLSIMAAQFEGNLMVREEQLCRITQHCVIRCGESMNLVYSIPTSPLPLYSCGVCLFAHLPIPPTAADA